MTFLLRVAGDRWHANVAAVLAENDDAATGGMLVPVAKSNGYGLGQAVLARQMRRRGRGVLSVGTVHEALEEHLEWDADLLVLTPWNVAETAATQAWQRARQRYGTRLITTVADSASLRALAEQAQHNPARPIRVLLEGLTSVRRFGLIQPGIQADLRDPVVAAALASGALRLAGLALHLPMVTPEVARSEPTRHLVNEMPDDAVIAGSGKTRESAAWGLWWLAQLSALDLGPDADLSCAAHLWVSHLSAAELRGLRAALPDVPVHPRIGTALWLGDLAALQAYGVVLAVHPAGKGGAGYFQRRVPSGAHLVIVGGGTVHGVAMNAPIGKASLRRRMTAVAYGALDAAGRALSPFRWQGKRLRFLEAPHASVSLVVVPKGLPAPAVGDELPCQVRFSTSRFDQVLGLE